MNEQETLPHLTSEDLSTIQKALNLRIKTMLRKPLQADYEAISGLCLVVDKVDQIRRAEWNGEKFGPYEDMVDEFVEATGHEFAADDIPF